MDPSRDNPFIRFQAFWLGLGVFFLFAVLLGVFWLFNRSDAGSPEEAAAAVRLETKAKVFDAQVAALPPEAIEAAIDTVAARLAASKPAAIEDPAQLVPGSATAQALADAPAGDFSEVDAMTDPNAPVEPAVMETGKAQFLVCGACHGQNGEGSPAGPPLAGSEWVLGPVSNLVRIQLRGLTGPITVAGQEYHFPAGMAPMAYQTDEQIAAVLTFVRNSFGNEAPPVTPEQVAALRSEVGKPQLTADELVAP
jgi:mono/diheme cytochrome c family protein